MGSAPSTPHRNSNESRPISYRPAPHQWRTSDNAPATNHKGRTYPTTSAIPLDRPLCPYHKYQGSSATNPYTTFVSQPSICWKCKEGEKDQKKRRDDVNTGPPDLPSDRHEDNRKRKPARSPSRVQHHEQEESKNKSAEEKRERIRSQAKAAQIRAASDTVLKPGTPVRPVSAGPRQPGARGPYPSRSPLTPKFPINVPPNMANRFKMPPMGH